MSLRGLEFRIAERVISDALAAGLCISVNDGEAFPVKRSTDRQAVCDALGATDEESLILRRANGERVGFVLFTWGEGADVLADYTDTPEMRALVAGAEGIADA